MNERVLKSSFIRLSNNGYEFSLKSATLSVSKSESPSPLVGLLTDRYFIKLVRKYLSERDIQRVKETSKALREAVFKFLYLFKISSLEEKVFAFLREFKNPLPFLATGEVSLKLIIRSEAELEFILKRIAASKVLKQYGSQPRIEAIEVLENAKDFAPLIKLIPPSITIFKCHHSSDGVLDLREFPILEKVQIGYISGKLILPVAVKELEIGYIDSSTIIMDPNSCNIESCLESLKEKIILPCNLSKLRCGGVEAGVILDLSKYLFLKSIEMGNVRGSIKGPKSLSDFKCKDIERGALVDLSECINLERLKVGCINDGLIKIPASTKYFECTCVAGKDVLDLTGCGNLQVVKIKGYNKKIKLPKNIMVFECEDVEKGVSVNLKDFENLKVVKIGDFDGGEKLPASLENFECRNIGEKITLELSNYENLRLVKTNDIKGKIKLPVGITSFECGKSGADVVVDLSQCCKLKTLRVSYIEEKGQLILSRRYHNSLKNGIITSEVSSRITWIEDATPLLNKGILSSFGYNYDSQVSGQNSGGLSSLEAYLKLIASLEELSEVELDNIDEENLSIPSNISRFECGHIGANAFLDLNKCIHLKEMVVGDVEGELIIPSNIEFLKCGDIGKTVALGLREHFQLKSVDIGKLNGAMTLSPSVVEFKCKEIAPGATLNLGLCDQLKKLK